VKKSSNPLRTRQDEVECFSRFPDVRLNCGHNRL